jgi:hypothetical protein
MEPHEQPPTPASADRGLDSIADLRALTRLMFYGLAGVVIIGAIATVVARKWFILLLLVGAYVVIAAIQWVAVHHRLAGKRDPR